MSGSSSPIPRAGRRALIRQSPCDLRSTSNSPNSSSSSIIYTASRCASTSQTTLDNPALHHGTIKTSSGNMKLASEGDTSATPDDEACFVDFGLEQRRVDFIVLLPSEIATHILSLLPHHNDILSCTLVSKTWNALCYDSQIWLRQFENRRKDGWSLVDEVDVTWRSILKNADRNEADLLPLVESGVSGYVPLASRRRAGVRVDGAILPSSSASQMGDVSMDSVDFDLTRVSIQSDAEYYGDGIDWFAVYQARFFLTKRWSLDDEEPEPATMPSSCSTDSSWTNSYTSSINEGSWVINEQDEISLRAALDPPSSSNLNDHSFEPDDKHLVGHSDSVYCVRFDRRPFKLPVEVVKSLSTRHQSGPLYDPRTSLGLGSYGKILSGSRDHTIRVWDGDSGICLHTLKGHDGSVLCLEYDDEFLFSASSDKTVILWDLKVIEKGFTPMAIKRIRGHTKAILDLSINEKWLITCGKDETVRVYDRTESCRLTRVYSRHDGPINAGTLNLNPLDGKTRAVTASGEGGVQLWDVETGDLIRNFVGHAKGLACVKYLDNRIVTGSNDNTIRVWDAETGRCLCICKGHENLVRAVGFDPSRKLIVSGGYDGKVKLFYLGREMHSDAVLPTDGSETFAFWNIDTGHEARVFDVQMDTSRILSCGEDKRICVRDFSRGSPLMRLFK